MNIGWTVGEEILFKVPKIDKKPGSKRKDICKAVKESCVLAIDKKGLNQIKRSLLERGQQDEFSKIEIVLRGNHLIKKDWK